MKAKVMMWVMVVLCCVTAQVDAADRAVLTTTDFSSGSLAVLERGAAQAQVNLLNIHSDAVVKTRNGLVYVLNRKGQDNILVLDSATPGQPLRQFSVGNGTNPQDIAFASDTRAYVARLESRSLLVVNPATGDSLARFDLSFAADADGFAEAAMLTIYDGRLYITCQRLNQDAFFAPTDHSEVLVMDLATETFLDLDATRSGVQGIVMQARNPFEQVRVGSKLVLSCIGTFDDMADGGIEVLDLAANRSDGVRLSGATLGGNPGSVAMVSDDRGYVVVSDATFANIVKEFHLSRGAVGGVLAGTSGGYIPAIATLKNRLYVCDQGSFGSPQTVGVRIYNTDHGGLVSGPISTGLPPNAIAFLQEDTSMDFDTDGDVDFTDFLLFARSFGTSSEDSGWDARFDLDGDGTVKLSDFILFARVYGQ